MGGSHDKRNQSRKTYIVEHIDPELGAWSTLEYKAIAEESAEAAVDFVLSSIPNGLEIPSELKETAGLVIDHRNVESLFKDGKEYVCLLDPAAHAELKPEDAALFDVFLFGGILGASSIAFVR
ncbi:hypothetical protein MMC21_008324 [Puttea exsequens]|nr:hypothetical protein [Puttea exsequens]